MGFNQWLISFYWKEFNGRSIIDRPSKEVGGLLDGKSDSEKSLMASVYGV